MRHRICFLCAWGLSSRVAWSVGRSWGEAGGRCRPLAGRVSRCKEVKGCVASPAFFRGCRRARGFTDGVRVPDYVRVLHCCVCTFVVSLVSRLRSAMPVCVAYVWSLGALLGG